MSVEVIETGTFGTSTPSATVWCRVCGQEQWFLNPTAARIRWYKDSHRCGGAGWQEASIIREDDAAPAARDALSSETGR